MIYKTAVTILVAIFSMSEPGFAQGPKPDFSGTWELDAKASEGVPAGMNQTMLIKQEGDRLDVQIKVADPNGERTLADSYAVTGQEADFTPAMVQGGKPTKGKRTAKWSSDGSGFDVSEQATIESSEGTDEVKGTRTWRLAAGGRSLTIEMDIQGPNGAMKSKRVFNKK